MGEPITKMIGSEYVSVEIHQEGGVTAMSLDTWVKHATAERDRYKRALEEIIKHDGLVGPNRDYNQGALDMKYRVGTIAEQALAGENQISREEVNLTAGDPDFGAGEE